MYHLEPPHVFVHKRVHRNPRAAAVARPQRALSRPGRGVLGQKAGRP